MAKIIKAADWEGDFLNIYEQIERKDLSPNAIEHKWIPHGVAKQGTSLNANFLNEIQKNSIYGILETNYKNIDNIDKYTLMNFEGLGDTGVFKDLKIKVLITNTNKYDSPKIVINSKEYSILYSVKSGIQNLKKELFVENQVYNMTYNGIGFIIENGNFKATENELGTLTLNDVRREIARLSGGPYGGLFGAELTSITKDKMYIYINEDGSGSVYKALNTKSNSSGFLVPNSVDFYDITNNRIAEYEYFIETRNITGSNGVSISLSFLFQKYGRIVDFSIMNISVPSSGLIFNEGFKIVDFSTNNYKKFAPKKIGNVQTESVSWIKEFTLNRTHKLPISNEQMLTSRLVLMSDALSFYGLGSLGGTDFIRVEGSYISES